MSAPLHAPVVLVVEDEPGLRDGLVAAVQTLGFRARPAAGVREARRALDETPDCILLDIRLKDGDGLDWLDELKKGPLRDVPVIVATAYGDSPRTIRAMRDGAFDYLTKPFHLPQLLATVERAVKQRALARSAPAIGPGPAPASPRGGLVGASAAMLDVWKLIGRAAASQAPVLVTGESGVGKKLVARAIHEYSPHRDAPFTVIDMAALPAERALAELASHDSGTLFLSMGDLDPLVQTKLVAFLAEHAQTQAHAQSSAAPQAARARIIAGTGRPVRPGEGGTLREELYYRLAVLEIAVPPLRARRSDIPLLVAHALRSACARARAVTEPAMARLVAHDWPGNVRELFHVVERGAALCGGDVIDLPALPGLSAAAAVRPDAAAGADATDHLPLREAIAQLERRMITRALRRTRGNRSEAARQLGIARAQLYAKMEEHGIAGRAEEAAAEDRSP
jgi:DNA-binding NtrC family response regulator